MPGTNQKMPCFTSGRGLLKAISHNTMGAAVAQLKYLTQKSTHKSASSHFIGTYAWTNKTEHISRHTPSSLPLTNTHREIPSPTQHTYDHAHTHSDIHVGTLQNNASLDLEKTQTTKKRSGAKSFCNAAPILWNRQPDKLQKAKYIASFCQRLKSHLF